MSVLSSEISLEPCFVIGRLSASFLFKIVWLYVLIRLLTDIFSHLQMKRTKQEKDNEHGIREIELWLVRSYAILIIRVQ